MPKSEAGLFVEYCAKDFLDGTQMLDPWEELAYRRVCDMIYATNDRLLDDDRKLAWATKTGRRWPAIKAALTSGEKPKLLIVDGRITNIRCQEALGTAARKIAQKVVAGRASAASGNALKNLKRHRTDVGEAVRQPVGTEYRTNHLTNKPIEKHSLTGVQKEPAKARRRQVPEDWLPSDAGREFARDRARWSEARIEREIEHFRAHHRQKGNVFADVDAGWRTWILNGVKYAEQRSNGVPPQIDDAPSASDDTEQWRARLRVYTDPALGGPKPERWHEDTWGPRPGHPGCRAPPALLEEFGLLFRDQVT